jgi:hypothetical protein
MTDTPLSWAQIFDLYRKLDGGGYRPSLLAADLGVTANTANQWRRRLFIPVIYWPRLLAALEKKLERAVDNDELVAATIAADAASKREAA